MIANRWYECYNLFEHIVKKGWTYVIHVKDIVSNEISTGLYLPVSDKGNYPIIFRLVVFAISEDTYEVIVTNFSEKEFTARE